MLAPNLDIAANIFLGNEARAAACWRRCSARELNRQRRGAARARRARRCRRPRRSSTLTAGQMQMVEIAKALSLDARIIIMDEPTSSLTAGESEQLFEIIRQLQAPTASASSTSRTAWRRC